MLQPSCLQIRTRWREGFFGAALAGFATTAFTAFMGGANLPFGTGFPFASAALAAGFAVAFATIAFFATGAGFAAFFAAGFFTGVGFFLAIRPRDYHDSRLRRRRKRHWAGQAAASGAV